MTLCPSYECTSVANPLQATVDGLTLLLAKYYWASGLLGSFVASQCLYCGYIMVIRLLIRRREEAAAAAAAENRRQDEEGGGSIIRERRRWWCRQKEAEKKAEQRIISLHDSSTEEELEWEDETMEDVAGAGALWPPTDEATIERCLRKSTPPKSCPFITSVRGDIQCSIPFECFIPKASLHPIPEESTSPPMEDVYLTPAHSPVKEENRPEEDKRSEEKRPEETKSKRKLKHLFKRF